MPECARNRHGACKIPARYRRPRAVAVLAVVLHHLSARLMPGGYVGVDVFFVSLAT